jgi:hypothetical protein
MSFDPDAFGPTFAKLIDPAIVMPLGPGSATGSLPTDPTVEQCFGHTTVTDSDMAKACISGVLLLHDELDRSHTISQSIDTTTGSYWHGIMHRREPDYSNAKYWFRNVGDHPLFSELADAVGQSQWDPFAFIDQCEQAARTGDGVDDCLRIQMIEWQLLFAYSYEQATA